MSPENRPSIRKRILHGTGGAMMLIGGISSSIGLNYNLLANQLPAENRYHEELEKLKKGEIEASKLPEEPDSGTIALDIVLGEVVGPMMGLVGYEILKSQFPTRRREK